MECIYKDNNKNRWISVKISNCVYALVHNNYTSNYLMLRSQFMIVTLKSINLKWESLNTHGVEEGKGNGKRKE